MFRILQAVADTDDAVGIRDVQLGVGLIRDKVNVPAADRGGLKVDFLADHLDLRLFSCRSVLEGTRADGAHLGSQDRDRNDRHDLSADGRFDELNVTGFGVILQLHGVGGAAGLQLHRETGCKITAVDGAAHKNRGGLILARKHGKGVGIGVGAEVFISCAADKNQAVYPALLHLFHLGVGELPEDHGIEPVAGGVAELSQFAAQFQPDRSRGHAVMLDVHPHVPVIGFLHLRHLLRSRLFPPEASAAH